ncbi:MAG: DUF2189 domain-containing protein [Tepidimonas sp.]|uniref:DUF2189 domain-containing protein n=1 Tax=Tepidimonas sp. TaxID=2002775 RepID=UPI004054D47E
MFSLTLASLSPADPLRWLAQGWRDLVRCPRIGLFCGACFALMGQALWQAFQHPPAYVLALSAGFLRMGPFLALGLYDASRALDRQTDAESAALTSLRAGLQNPGVMFLWGALITGLCALAMLPAFLGLLVVGPVLGHATWHAYRHIVPAPVAALPDKSAVTP